MKERWFVYSEPAPKGGGWLVRYPELMKEVKLPADAERSGDGNWATVYDSKGEPLRHFVRALTEARPRRRLAS